MKIAHGRPVARSASPGCTCARPGRPALLGLVGYVAVRRRLPRHPQRPGHRVCSSSRPSPPAQPGYVNDVLAVATGSTPVGDVGPIQTLNQVGGFAYILGGFLFGIALFRAGILPAGRPRCSSVGAVATVAPPGCPRSTQRLFAVPIGVALIGLGWSLWREQRSSRRRPVAPARLTLTARPGRRPVTDQRRPRTRPGRPVDRVGAVRADRPRRDPGRRRLAPPGRVGRRPAAACPPTPGSPPPPCRWSCTSSAPSRMPSSAPSSSPPRCDAAGPAGTGWPDGSLVVLGLAVALSALWMTLFYARQPGTGELAYLFRLAFGSAWRPASCSASRRSAAATSPATGPG